MASLQADCKFFSSLSKAHRVKGVERGAKDFEGDHDNPTIPTGQDKNFNTLQLFVESQIDVDHPIVFQQHNLCQLAKEGRMGELRLDASKKACQELEAEVTGSKRKKETHLYPQFKELQILLQYWILVCSLKTSCKYSHKKLRHTLV